MKRVQDLLAGSLGFVSGEALHESLDFLVWPGAQSPIMARRRAAMIIARVRLVAMIFAVLTPLWVFVDMAAFPRPVWEVLALARAVAMVAFVLLSRLFAGSERMEDAYISMAAMFAIPTVFYMLCFPYLSGLDMTQWAGAVIIGLALLPFIVLGGLSILPLTASEGLAYALPLLVSDFVVLGFLIEEPYWYPVLGITWLLTLMAVLMTLAGMSQLHLMNALVRQITFDPLTKMHVRGVGEEILDIQFRIAERQDDNFSLAFIDIDDFKKINDAFGHEEGDRILGQVSENLHRNMRAADVLVRWGGEEFLYLFPNTDLAGAEIIMARLYQQGLGSRPDGDPLTVSIGIAERKADGAEEWSRLVQIADERMYRAKKAGKNRYISG